MKNPVFLTLWLMAIASFAAQAGHHEADKEQVVIGMGLSMDGEFNRCMQDPHYS